MTTISKRILALGACSLLVAWSARGQQATGEHAGESIHTPQDIEWGAGPPSLPSGAELALLEGDPTQEGPFTMRLKFPDGYRVPPHTHPKVEHITVLRGTFHFGMGAVFEKSGARAMPAGSFGFWPAGMQHFAWAKGETVVQLHGIGPWSIEYVNPADDPRTSQKSGQ